MKKLALITGCLGFPARTSQLASGKLCHLKSDWPFTKPIRIHSVLVLAALGLLAGAATSSAVSLTWDANTGTADAQDGGGTWTNANWLVDGIGSNVPWDNAVTNDVVFGATNGVTAGEYKVSVSTATTVSVGNITINPSGNGYYNLGAQATATSKLNLVDNPTITVADGVGAVLSVPLTGTSFTKAGMGTLTNIPATDNLNSGPTFINEGTMVMGSSGGRLVIPGDMTVAAGALVRMGAANGIADSATLTVQGIFESANRAETISTLVLDGGTFTQGGSETWVVTTADFRSGSMSGGTGKLDAGTVTKITSGTVTLGCRGSSTSFGFINTVLDEGTLVFDYIQNSSKLRDAGSLTVNGGLLIITNGTHTETVASVILAGGVITNDNSTVKLSVPTNPYDVRSGAAYTVFAGNAGLTKSTAGTVTLGAANTFSGDTRLNEGVLVLADAGALGSSVLDLDGSDTGSLSFGTLTTATLGGLKGSRNLALENGSSAAVALTVGNSQSTTYSGNLTGTGSLEKVGSGTLLVDGTIGGTGVTVSAGTLGGNGTITTAVEVQSGGKLSPGASLGVLTINSTLTLQSGSTTIMELDKTTGTNDVLTGMASVTYGGTLSVTNLDGTLAAGDSFELFTASSYGGAFDSIDPATPGDGLEWDTTDLTVNGTLKVAAAASAQPTIDSIVKSGSDIILAGTGGTEGADYYVLSSTNVVLPLGSWTVLVTNQFDVGGSFAFTNAITPGMPQEFYLIQVP